MTLECEHGIIWAHTASIIGDANISTISANSDFNLAGTGINRIFNKFFND